MEVAPLDELLEGWPPTYMKFDVEGAEHDALVGGANTIRENKPVLAVCLYHRPEDLWDLPLLIRSIQPEYALFVRRHSDERWETVCYAIPTHRMQVLFGGSTIPDHDWLGYLDEAAQDAYQLVGHPPDSACAGRQRSGYGHVSANQSCELPHGQHDRARVPRVWW